MATFVPFHELGNTVGKNLVDLDSHTFKAVLTNSAPTQAGSLILTDITQIANANGYVTGGVTLTGVAYAETGGGTGIWQWTSNAWAWTAAGGDIGPFRYTVTYDDTASNKELVGFVDYGTNVTLTNGNTLTVTPGANGIFRLTVT